MTRRASIAIVALVAVVAATMLSAGCVGSRLRSQAQGIREINKRVKDQAERCAPKEIAVAKAEVEFGEHELDRGNFARAREHIYRAEKYAKLAEEYSQHEACKTKEGSMQVEEAESVELKEGPKDQDGDGINDSEDKCPKKPEDPDGFEDEDGCPDDDNDQDGIADSGDDCVNVSEGEPDGYKDNDGCPDPDNDKDGLADINDNCGDKTEDFDDFEDEDGCPDPDNDDDRITDAIGDSTDECPNKAEDYDGDVDDDGCPEERKRVTVEKEEIKLNKKVHFASGKAKIQKKSYPLLKSVADVLEDNPNIEVRVEGHTDSRGGDAYNRKLSQRRAESVVDFLAGKGIDKSRLKPKGFGESKPIESNATKAGRAANRRVEIHIISR